MLPHHAHVLAQVDNQYPVFAKEMPAKKLELLQQIWDRVNPGNVTLTQQMVVAHCDIPDFGVLLQQYKRMFAEAPLIAPPVKRRLAKTAFTHNLLDKLRRVTAMFRRRREITTHKRIFANLRQFQFLKEHKEMHAQTLAGNLELLPATLHTVFENMCSKTMDRSGMMACIDEFRFLAGAQWFREPGAAADVLQPGGLQDDKSGTARLGGTSHHTHTSVVARLSGCAAVHPFAAARCELPTPG